MGRTWTQATSNLPPDSFFGQGNLALRPRFLRTFCPFCDSIGPYNPGASAPLFSDRQVGLTPPSQPSACAAHLKLAALYDPSNTLTPGTSVLGARTPSFAPVAGGIYAPTVATSVLFSLRLTGLYDPSLTPSQPVPSYHTRSTARTGASTHVMRPSASSQGAAENLNLYFFLTSVAWGARNVFCNEGVDFFEGGEKVRRGGSMIVDVEVAKETIELILTGQGVEMTVQHGDGRSRVVDKVFDVGLVVCEGVRSEGEVKESYYS